MSNIKIEGIKIYKDFQDDIFISNEPITDMEEVNIKDIENIKVNVCNLPFTVYGVYEEKEISIITFIKAIIIDREIKGQKIDHPIYIQIG